MYFNKLKQDAKDPRKKYIVVKKHFNPRDRIKEEYVEESFEFAYSMTFGRSGKHRSYRSGGSHRRKNGEIFANTFQGKLCEFALYQTLKDKNLTLQFVDTPVSSLVFWPILPSYQLFLQN